MIHEMFSSNENGANAIPKFNSYLGPRWTRWLTSFELFDDSKGSIINDNANANTKQRRRAFLLHLSGSDAQGIFSTLADTGAATDYTALNGYFVPKVNPAFARQSFHRIHQKEGETVLQFVTQLSKEVKDCKIAWMLH